MPVMMAVSTDLTDFNTIFTKQNSIFNFPVACLEYSGAQPETKESWELFKSKCPLISEAFSADDQLLIGSLHRDTEE